MNPPGGRARGRQAGRTHSTRGMRRAPWVALLLAAAACHHRGTLAPSGAADGAAGAGGSTTASGGNDGGMAGGGIAGGGGASGTGGGVAGSTGAGGFAADPGFVGMRRLSDVEYANTLQDVLGLTGDGPNIAAALAASADPAPPVVGPWAVSDFDNLSSGPVIGPARFQAYFGIATAELDVAFATDAARARILTCAPTSPIDETCARTIIGAFGLRAWRRPLTPDEVDAFAALARAARAAGGDFTESMRQVVQAMLVSESFLYRLEFDTPVASVAPHPLTSYDLATRLSYLLWSTTPDDQLLQLAATNALRTKATLMAQATRLLADPRAAGFVDNFFGQWLGFRALRGATLDRVAPGWSGALQASMAQEASLFVDAVVKSDGGFGALLTTDVNFVDRDLASLYDFTLPTTGSFLRVVNAFDGRKGYLGLAAMLTATSHPDATSATWRGRWVLEHLLCTVVPTPPQSGHPTAPLGNAAEQLATVAKTPVCNACHSFIDRVGLGLEKFDQIGRFGRSTIPAPFASTTAASCRTARLSPVCSASSTSWPPIRGSGSARRAPRSPTPSVGLSRPRTTTNASPSPPSTRASA
jgi:hypothetical protein